MYNLSPQRAHKLDILLIHPLCTNFCCKIDETQNSWIPFTHTIKALYKTKSEHETERYSYLHVHYELMRFVFGMCSVHFCQCAFELLNRRTPYFHSSNYAKRLPPTTFPPAKSNKRRNCEFIDSGVYCNAQGKLLGKFCFLRQSEEGGEEPAQV